MSDRKDKGVTSFEATEDAYTAKIRAAKAAKVPLGGAPMPAMPRFDQAPPDRHAGVQSREGLHRVLTPEQQQELAASGRMVHGVGQAYAANQPRVGVPEQPQPPGSVVNPPRPEGAGLSDKTVEQLQAVAVANAKKEEAKTDEDLDKISSEIDEIDESYETDEFGKRIRNLLANRERRDAIEARCEPLTIDELFTHGEIRQRVPVVPGKFEPTFRSVGGNEDLFIKSRMSKIRGSDQYILDMFTVMNLTAGLYSMNKSVFPNHLDREGEVNETAFDVKFKTIVKLPRPILADLSVNYIWFSRRLEKLLVVDQIKGF